MLSVIDAIVIVFLAFGVLIGFKRGIIKSAVSFIGTLLIIFLAFVLKNPLSELMYENLPFFNFTGSSLEGVTVFNVLIYEGIAFLIVFGILEVLLRILVFASGILEKLLRITIVLGFISKILGAIFGFIEFYLIAFVALFIMNNIAYTSSMVQESQFGTKIIMNTPVLKGYADDEIKAVNEILSLADQYKNNKTAYNENAFEILIKYGIISEDSAKKLLESDKISIDNGLDIINKYKDVIKGN